MYQFLNFFGLLMFWRPNLSSLSRPDSVPSTGYVWMVMSTLLNVSFWAIAGAAAVQTPLANAQATSGRVQTTELWQPIKAELIDADADSANSREQ